MYALVDCNNFYCSCERVFNPKLIGKPIVVLSNNDGCVIARSEEAKLLGIIMGSPAFMIDNLLARHNVSVFSSNYTLYGDMSARIMSILETFVPTLETFSIDEAFLDLHNMPMHNLYKLGVAIRSTVLKCTGIPVTVGIAPTKTLAKMANRHAKKKTTENVFFASETDIVAELLRTTDVADITGIGHQHAVRLLKAGIRTAADFAAASDDWIRKHLTVVGLRLVYELRGIPAISWGEEVQQKKSICTSRSFGKILRTKKEVNEALVNFAANCALKLRREKGCCKTLQVFVQTNPHKKEEKQYMRSIDVSFEVATNDTAEIIKYASRGLDLIFKEGYNYMKCGVTLMDISGDAAIQAGLFDHAARQKKRMLTEAVDNVNSTLGKELVRRGIQGFSKGYRLRADRLSSKYTTKMNEILKIKI